MLKVAVAAVIATTLPLLALADCSYTPVYGDSCLDNNQTNPCANYDCINEDGTYKCDDGSPIVGSRLFNVTTPWSACVPNVGSGKSCGVLAKACAQATWNYKDNGIPSTCPSLCSSGWYWAACSGTGDGCN